MIELKNFISQIIIGLKTYFDLVINVDWENKKTLFKKICFI